MEPARHNRRPIHAAESHLTFGPFHTSAAAKLWIFEFIQDHFSVARSTELGIIWIEPAGMTVLKVPHTDAKTGIRTSFVVEWTGSVPPMSKPEDESVFKPMTAAVREAYGWIGRQKHALSQSLDRQQNALSGKLKSASQHPWNGTGEAYWEQYKAVEGWILLRTAWREFEEFLSRHPIAADVVASGFDTIGAIGGLIGMAVFFPLVFTPIGGPAFLASASTFSGSVALLRVDGRDAYLRVKGDLAANLGQVGAGTLAALQTSTYEHSTLYRRTELLAPILTLPGIVVDTAATSVAIEKAAVAVRDGSKSLVTAAATSDKALQELTLYDERTSELNTILDELKKNEYGIVVKRRVLSLIEKLQTEKNSRIPRKSLKTDVEMTSERLKVLSEKQTDLSAEYSAAWKNSIYRPHFEKLRNKVLGLSKVPTFPLTADIGALGVVVASTPGILKTFSTPSMLPYEVDHSLGGEISHRKEVGTGEQYLNFSLFCSTGAGQPAQ